MARRLPGGWRRALAHAFAVPGEAPLTDGEEAVLKRLADGIVRRGLSVPSMLLLRSLRPVEFLGGQAVAFFRPVVSLVFPQEQCGRVAELLSRRGVAERLAAEIEQCDRRRRSAPERR